MGRKGRQGRGGGRDNGGLGGLTEVELVRLRKMLEEFRESDALEYKFDSSLSKQERAAVHEMCKKMGMKSKSTGGGQNRRLNVYKRKNRQKNSMEDEADSCFKLSADAYSVLQDLFSQYPPESSELSGATQYNLYEKARKGKSKQDSKFCKPSIGKADIEKKIQMLASKINESTHLKKIAEERARLPIASYKDVITSILDSHQVVLVSGETGCGKTTQVPQYILDYMWGKGENCKVICTQPRRISAISVAERISSERGEPVGETVGYAIRLEAKGGKNSSIMFCTNGVLLRVLIGKGSSSPKSAVDELMEITHIIVDEIHERDRFSDFMLAILRDLLPAYPHLRLVLMSATIDSERFSQYFNGCPVIQVPGFTHPVKSFYLEDVLSILRSRHDNHLNFSSGSYQKEDDALVEDDRSALDESIDLALNNDELEPLLELITNEQNPCLYNLQHSETGVTPLMVLAGKGQLGDVCMLLSFGVDYLKQDKDGRTALDWALQENQQDVCEVIRNHMESKLTKVSEGGDLLDKYFATINPEHIDTVLIEKLLRKICSDSEHGAILVFLPGWEDINLTKERLLASSDFQDPSRFLILSLHSLIPASEQKKVFKHPPPGVRKIILSTNIAETAVTIDDVVFVVDTGRMKEKSYDPYNNVSTLHSSWVSKASARQREGRAGRCQPGICYHLFSKVRAESFPEFQVPEIKRMPIEELCLQVKLLDPECRIADFLKKTMDPPILETIRNATIVLQGLGALTSDEQLTELGQKLGSLPVHPCTSKMLLFAILMNCLDPALTLACAVDYRDPFVLPMAPHDRKRAYAAKVELASLYGGYSDQLAVVAAFDCWRNAKDRGQEQQFCSAYFVSSGTLNMLFNMRKQLQNELVRNGFVPADISSCSLNAKDPGILRAVLVAGAYPMVGRLLPRSGNKRTVVESPSGAKVRLHPQSCNFNLSVSKVSGRPLIIFDEITNGDNGMYIKNSSIIGQYPLLLLATEMVAAPPENCDEDGSEDNEDFSDDDEIDAKPSSSNKADGMMSSPDNAVTIVIDRWLRFKSTAIDLAQIYCLRERLAAAIMFKVKFPQDILPPALGASMYAVTCILSYDGLPTMVLSDTYGQENNPNVAESVNSSGAGRTPAYIPPSGYLRSLLSDNTRRGGHHQSNQFQAQRHNMTAYASTGTNRYVGRRPFARGGGHRGGGRGNSGPPAAHVGGDGGGGRGGVGRGNAGPRNRSFKRQREANFPR